MPGDVLDLDLRVVNDIPQGYDFKALVDLEEIGLARDDDLVHGSRDWQIAKAGFPKRRYRILVLLSACDAREGAS